MYKPEKPGRGQYEERPHREEKHGEILPLLDGPAFSVEALRINEPLALDTMARPWVYVVLGGKGSLVTDRGEWRLRRGESWLLPAALGAHRFGSVDGELEILRVGAR